MPRVPPEKLTIVPPELRNSQSTGPASIGPATSRSRGPGSARTPGSKSGSKSPFHKDNAEANAIANSSLMTNVQRIKQHISHLKLVINVDSYMLPCGDPFTA
eukprot:1793195-Pyramimonas_sp.AAC.1